ncbi:helix-turn-helix domain-containing protein [Thioclava sp. BHET1]|nr:helix-turn-helix domain-containing protein [Thioclava sp. BHET1]
MRIRSETGWWLAPAGRGIWVPPGILHSAHYSEVASFVLLKIPAASAGDLFDRPRAMMVSDLLRELALEICLCADAEDRALLSRLVLSRIRKANAAPALFLPIGKDTRLLRLMEDLRQDPGQTADLNVLAQRAGSSRRTMSRLFLAETGMSFAHWRDHLRIVTALDLLVRGMPIVEVALTLGYQGQSSFTNMFTRIMGSPPRRYLRALEDSHG